MRNAPSDADFAALAATQRLIWAIIGAMCVVLVAGYAAAGLSLDLASGRFVLPLAPLCAGVAWFYRRYRPDPWISYGTEAVAQVIAVLILGTLLAYAAAATAFPYRDAELNALDRALGLDWRGYFDFVATRPWLGLASNLVYFSMKPQTALILGTLVLTAQFARLQRFTLALALALALTLLVFAFVPAVGAFAHIGLMAADTPNYAPSMTYEQMVQLDGIRGGTLTVISFDRLEGLIAFPSFHTAAGVLATWALWSCRPLRWPVAALNAAMIASTPCDGAHYFVDVAAGGLVAAMAIVAATKIQRALARSAPAVAGSAPEALANAASPVSAR